LFIRELVKHNKGYQQKFIYHVLVESFRTSNGPRQRVLLNLGKLTIPPEKWKDLSNRIDEIVNGQKSIFHIDNEIEDIAQHYATLLIDAKMREQFPEAKEGSEYHEVDIKSMRIHEARSIGGEHVSLSMLRRMHIDSRPDGKSC
jgi:hypothetical protein